MFSWIILLVLVFFWGIGLAANRCRAQAGIWTSIAPTMIVGRAGSFLSCNAQKLGFREDDGQF